MAKSPKISVVIPTYNRASCIARTIDSVLAQTYDDYELIVVDDGSEDQTREVLRPYGDTIRYIYQRNCGVSVARNAGIMASQGDWVAFLDSDDEWMPTKLEKQIETADSDPSVVALVANAIIELSAQTEIDLFKIRGFQVDADISLIVSRPLSLIIELQPFTTPSLIVRRDTLFSVGLFDSSMTLYEDHDLMCRLAMKGPWAITGETLVRVYRRGDVGIALSMQHARDPLLSARNIMKTCVKLLTNPGLSRNERRLVRKRLSSFVLTRAWAFTSKALRVQP